MLTPTTTCLDNHSCFRALLQAMSRPGTIQRISQVADAEPYDGMVRLLDTLLDPQVSFCLLEDDDLLCRRVQKQTGAAVTSADAADFLVVPKGDSHGCLQQARIGDLDYPDRSATVIYQVETVAQAQGPGGISLTGPGIKEQVYPQLTGLAAGELSQLKALNQDFPLGIDALFIDVRGRLMGLPRSTHIEGV